MKFFNRTYNEVINILRTDVDKGLSTSEVSQRQAQYGKNEFTPHEQESLFAKILSSLKEPMIVILLFAAIISAVIGEYADAFGIVVAVGLGIAIGLFTEGKSQKAADALSKISEDIEVKVLRDGVITRISKSELVPGDIVFVETGDMVPADGRLVDALNLKVREDMLTGEADDVKKTHDVCIEQESIVTSKGETVIQDPVPAKQINMLFGGTFVAQGKGTFVVTTIGDNTEMGKIAQNLQTEDEETPLQIKLGDLGSTISKISSAIAGLLFIFMTYRLVAGGLLQMDTTSFDAFMLSIDPIKKAFIVCIALIVAAVPEGLPTMVNMTLAMTMQKMAKINALVTKKEACETIGSVSVICSDKTGTLTQNRMTVDKVYIDGGYVNSPSNSLHSYFEENCLLNSTADIEISGNETKYLGSATECALLLYHKKKDYIAARKNAHLLAQIPFSSQFKRMTSVVAKGNDYLVLSKGAPEVLLNFCTHMQDGDKVILLTDEKRSMILSEIERLQNKSMRTLGFAYKTVKADDKAFKLLIESETIDQEKLEAGLIFSGFVGIKDPLRVDVPDAVKKAKTAGIITKMLTGDNIHTAKAIGSELGLLDDGMRAVESSYIDTLTDEELQEEIKTINIVARSKPDTKMRVVSALQKNGEVVAVTGDGINDAPALNKADVGIAMGIAGTEVSKSAADIILVDDSFSTIVEGVKWGRGIYDNFQRFIQFQVTVNIIAFFIAVVSQIMGHEMPFTTIQLLWVNIIMDGPPALALGLEPVRKGLLENRKPINRKASIITKSMIGTMAMNAVYISCMILAQMLFNPLGATAEQSETVLFGIFAFSALFNAFNCRELGLNSIVPEFFSNKLALQIVGVTIVCQLIFSQVFSSFFNTVPLDFTMWARVLIVSVSVILFDEVIKLILRFVKKIGKAA